MHKGDIAIVNLQSVDSTNCSEGDEKRSWLKGLHKPWWLLNDIYSDEWVVTDPSLQSPETIKWDYIFTDSKGNIFSLTDPENFHLLETIQLVCFKMRDSHFSTCDSSDLQIYTARGLFTIISWMRLNNIFRFDQVTKHEFEKFKSECIFGKTSLLHIVGRLDRYVRNMHTNNEPLPKRPLHSSNKFCGQYTLDVVTIGKAIGVNLQNHIDPIIAYKLALLRLEEGLYLTPNQRKTIDNGEPVSFIKSAIHVNSTLMPWKRLWDLRTELNDTIKFDPFDGAPGLSVAKNAVKEAGNNSDESYTGTIPEYQAAFIIDRAIRWVINYSDDLLTLRDQQDRLYNKFKTKDNITSFSSSNQVFLIKKMNNMINYYKPIGFEVGSLQFPSQPWPVVAQKSLKSDDKRLTLSKAVNNFLPVACLIVICAFTANRYEAALNIYDDKQQDGDPNKPAIETDDEGDWLWCWVGKSIRNWDRVPCPRVVKKAVDVLNRLSETARNLNDSRKLFQYKSIGSNEVFSLTNIGSLLKEFVKFVEVPALEDGTHWNFTLHQFRKFFAILYMYGYEYGNLSALSHHMRHLDFKVTEDYVLKHSNDTTLSRMRKHHSADLLVDIANGKRKASGKGGEILSEMLEKLVKQALKNFKLIHVNQSPDTARRIAERVMQKLELTLVPFMWGYCAAFTKLEHGEFSGNCIECGMQATGPNLTKATPKNCSGCNHFYTDQHFKIWWQSMADIYDEHLTNPGLPDAFFAYTEEMTEMFRKGVEDFFGNKDLEVA